MFKNSVFKPSVNTKKWIEAVVVRCIRTFASTVVALVPTTVVTVGSVDWSTVFSGALFATIVIFFTCLAGIPEVSEE